jgi:pyruvate dehydrogenase E2 component (dihydrolipoamide acetyltransferase)
MAKLLEMPKLSPTMEEGVLSAWHKKEGDAIAVDDLLAEVETDKATMEFRSFDQTTLLKILVSAGAQVKLGQPVAIVGAPGEDVSQLAAGAGASVPVPAEPKVPDPAAVAPSNAPEPAKSPAATMPPPETAPPAAQRKPPVVDILSRTSFPSETRPEGAAAGRVMASPYVRKVAREKGIALEGAHGSGPGGRVVPADLDALQARGAPAPPPAAHGASQGDASRALARTGANIDDPEVRALTPMRRTIARRIAESKATVPHFYLTIDVDVAELVKLRARINAELAAPDGATEGDRQAAKVSINDLLIKACALALVRVPESNASYCPEAILIHKRVDISVAVAIPDGLVTPVVRHADQKSVAAIARETRDLAARARARKLKPEEMTDGTFSISNLGMFGIDQFAAVINPPEGAILAVGQVRQVPVVSDGAVIVGQRLALTLSCDHRVIDGAVGASFLAELRRLIEHPMRVLAG